MIIWVTIVASQFSNITMVTGRNSHWGKRGSKALHQIFNKKPADESADTDPNQSRQIDVDKMYTEFEDELAAIESNKMGLNALGLWKVNLRRNEIVVDIHQIEQPLQDAKWDEGASSIPLDLFFLVIYPITLLHYTGQNESQEMKLNSKLDPWKWILSEWFSLTLSNKFYANTNCECTYFYRN